MVARTVRDREVGGSNPLAPTKTFFQVETSRLFRDMRRFIISGRVQGVGFRYFTQRQAMSRQIVGWVRNRVDGTVEVVADGQGSDMKKFMEAVKSGPPWARVSSIEERKAPEETFNDFTILR